MHNWQNGHAWGGGHWIVLAGLMILFWGAVITVVVVALKRRNPAESGRSDQLADEPLRILAARFARGEIDEAEFISRREALLRTQ
jgi:Predicted membrane protein (DUF2078).